ncbi:MAG: hypothetical protein KF847_09290 [Pirellulales bacterium]|nr:hypothetical protein [Pirellulales bacterium]
MKVDGKTLTAIGGLLVLSNVSLAIAEYDMNSSHDLSKFAGGLGLAVLVLLGGVLLIRKDKNKC